MKLAALLSMLALASGSERIELPVVVKATPSSCRVPKDATLDWAQDGTAVVKATVLFNDGVSVSQDSPRAYLEGNQLKACYNTSTQPRNPNAAIRMCLQAIDIEFTISKLPRGDYVPHVFSCDLPKVLYYKCVQDGKTTYTIYDTPNCTPVTSDNN
jgi:hypothetical protein